MKICFLSCFDDLLLRDTGSAVRIYNLAKGLAGRGHDVHVVIPSLKGDWYQKVDGISVHGFGGLLPAILLKFLTARLGVLRPSSLLFYDLFFISKAFRVMTSCDMVQAEQPTSAFLFGPLCSISGKPFVVDCHDVFQALRIEHTGFVRRALETFMERFSYRFADAVLVVSEKERVLLKSYRVVEDNLVSVIFNGVDCSVFAPKAKVHSTFKTRYGLDGSRVVVFVGNMEYVPNQEAVRIIASKIAPFVLGKVGDVRFLIVGRLPEDRDFSRLSGLTFTGSVDSVTDVLNIADVAIAPLFNGSGSRLKILEYLSCGIPVVSTSKGAEGLELSVGLDVFVEDDLEVFADRVVDLLGNVSVAKDFGKVSRKMVREKYDWRVMVGKLERIYENLLF